MTDIQSVISSIAEGPLAYRGGYNPNSIRSSDLMFILSKIDNYITSHLNVKITFKHSTFVIIVDVDDNTSLINIPTTFFLNDNILKSSVILIAQAVIEIIILFLSKTNKARTSLEMRLCLSKKIMPQLRLLFPSPFNLVLKKNGATKKILIDNVNNVDYITNDKVIRGGYVYRENSCYLDSLLMPMLFGISPFFRDILLNTNVIDFVWEGIKICPVKVFTDIERVEYVKNVQTKIREDYNSIVNGTRITCYDFRSILSNCDPDIMHHGRYTFYNTAAIYTTLTDLFPNLKMSIPRRIIGIRKEATIEVRDYLMESDILWDEFVSPILIFNNLGAIRILDALGDEEISFRINNTVTKEVVTKIRSLGHIILNDRYELFGVVVLLGVSPGREGGTHYVCYYKDIDNKWVFYNDMSGGPVATDLPRNGVFVEVDNQKPSLFFYRNID